MSLRFCARNVMLTTTWLDNRWLVKLSTKQCGTVLMGRSLVLNRQPIKMRRYDDVVKEEYEKYQKYLESTKHKRTKRNQADDSDEQKTTIFGASSKDKGQTDRDDNAADDDDDEDDNYDDAEPETEISRFSWDTLWTV